MADCAGCGMPGLPGPPGPPRTRPGWSGPAERIPDPGASGPAAPPSAEPARSGPATPSTFPPPPPSGLDGWGTGRGVAERPDDPLGLVGVVACTVGALASAGYACWAALARRTLFDDLAGAGAVDPDRISASDRLDAIATLACLVLAVAALLLWAHRHLQGRSRHDVGARTGMAAGGCGVIAVVAGLLVQNEASTYATQVARAESSSVGTLVVAAGFAVAAGGLAVGVRKVRKPPDPMPGLPASLDHPSHR